MCLDCASFHFYLAFLFALSSISLPLFHFFPVDQIIETFTIRDYYKIYFKGLLLFFWQILTLIK